MATEYELIEQIGEALRREGVTISPANVEHAVNVVRGQRPRPRTRVRQFAVANSVGTNLGGERGGVLQVSGPDRTTPKQEYAAPIAHHERCISSDHGNRAAAERAAFNREESAGAARAGARLYMPTAMPNEPRLSDSRRAEYEVEAAGLRVKLQQPNLSPAWRIRLEQELQQIERILGKAGSGDSIAPDDRQM